VQTRKLGFTDLNLTTIGFGTYALGGGDWQWAWGPQDDADSIAAIQRALELGINWIDTAPAYGQGHAEEIVGQAIKGRDGVIIATKCGIAWEAGSPKVWNHLKADHIRREVEQSLRRLKIDVIDLYQIHWPVPDEDIEEAWGVVAELVKAGKVRYGGVSNFSAAQMKRLQAIHPVASNQPPYSMVERLIEVDNLAFCAANNIGVVVYGPMESGLLTGKFTAARVASLPDNDWRKNFNVQFRQPNLKANMALVDNLRLIAERHGKSVGELAIAWTLRRPEVTAAIVGGRSAAQIEGTVGAGDWVLAPEEITEIEALLVEREGALA